MSANQTLIKTLVFQLSIESNNENLLYDASLEARRVYNETIRLAKAGKDWSEISSQLEEEAGLVKNTTQRIAAKALGAMENYREYEDFGLPSHTKDGPFHFVLTTERDIPCRLLRAEILHSVSARSRINT